MGISSSSWSSGPVIPRVLRGFALARVLAEKCQRILVVPKLMARVPLWGRLILGMSHYKISQTLDAESRALGDETAISSDELISCRMVGIFGCSFFGQTILVFSEVPSSTSREKKEKKKEGKRKKKKKEKKKKKKKKK